MLQSCDPYSNRKLLERLAHRQGITMPEVYEKLVMDVKAYYSQQVEAVSVE
ncbi:hypothetical protein [Jeotgalibacillus aurantiacus]|uniref:hypothetical protein n=1 Tax=Jeotgalibacillus aurantiacus TaxID=2763266 RepID=UPI001D0A9B9E|nr:hypothetical protein [Jeotgalibacillus aurantiacus]